MVPVFIRSTGILINTHIWGHVQYCQVWLNLYLIIYTKVWRATSGRRTPRRAADGRTRTPAGGGQGGALYYGWAYMLTLWGKGGYGGSPNVEAGKMYQHSTPGTVTIIQYLQQLQQYSRAYSLQYHAEPYTCTVPMPMV